MVVFLANRSNLQTKRLHDRIKTRLGTEFANVRRRPAEPRDPGPYRVVADVVPGQLLDDDTYPAETARIEVGFQLRTGEPYEYYWLNWIEPGRDVLVGWHQDGTHADLGPVHLQVNDRAGVADRQPVEFIDSHPLDVLERRLRDLPAAIDAVEWDNGRPIGFDPAAAVIA